ncbi:hypothetical protein [Chamaesiphon sp. GL140_3_metabinner_50]|uniref:hypothetical protein n=1 Tax=Chamaesiphon sp. GL140_3_metabinner_50 TaxID=2970812 RepID=UPI0025FFA33A|nr:hypothetical protein [Chamaesiphon sp. GL140_3_metabinner_50]
MRRKKTISLEKPAQAPIEYRFKLLLFPYLAYTIAVTILGNFTFGIFAFFNIISTNEAILTSIGFSSGLLVVELLALWFTIKKSDLILTAENISAVDLRYRRKSIGWQEITLLKHCHLFGIRYLSIKTADAKDIIVASRYYHTAQILDRVRELAGTEHILVRALEKELSRPRRELTKVWCWVIGSIALTMSIYLIGGNIYAAEQEQPLQQAIAAYISQHPQQAPNQSAIELQALMTKLGLSVNVFGDGSEVKVKSTTAAIDDWKSIEVPLYTFLNKQSDKTEDSVEPIPAKILTYLKNHQADLDAIETHLATNPLPEWGTDGWIAQSDPKIDNSPLFTQKIDTMGISHLESLTILKMLDRQQQPNTDFSKNLATLEKLQQSIQSQQSLMGQLTSIIGESRISRFVRQIDTPVAKLNARLPQGWGDNLFTRERHAQMIGAIEYESIVTNKFLLNADLFDRLLAVNYDSPSRFIPKLSYLIHPRLRLAAVDRHQEVTKGITYWRNQNICRTDGQSGIKSQLDFDDATISPTLLTSQYAKVIKQDLLWELTTSVRQVKAKLATGENADLAAKEFNLPSKVCQGEKWIAKSIDGSVNISFSHLPNWKALGMNNPAKSDSLTYTIKPIDRG